MKNYIAVCSGARHLTEDLKKFLPVFMVCNVDSGFFSDGELRVFLSDFDLPVDELTLIQSFLGGDSPNNQLMELLFAIEALKKAGVGVVNLVLPYLCYARQDRITDINGSLSSMTVLRTIRFCGANSITVFDVHSSSASGYFGDARFSSLSADFAMQQALLKSAVVEDIVIVSPDLGGVLMNRKFAEMIGADIAFAEKKRLSPGQSAIMRIEGDISNRICVIRDDIIDSGGTVMSIASFLKDRGAKKVIVCITHGVLSGRAADLLDKSDVDKIFVTNSINTGDLPGKFEVVSIIPTLCEFINKNYFR